MRVTQNHTTRTQRTGGADCGQRQGAENLNSKRLTLNPEPSTLNPQPEPLTPNPEPHKQAEAIVANLKVLSGADIRVTSASGPLDEAGIDALLGRLASPQPGRRAVVAGHAWQSWPLWNVDPPVYTTRVSNLIGWPTVLDCELVSVSPNYLAVAYGEYLHAVSTDGCAAAPGPDDCLRALAVPPADAIRVRSRDRVFALARAATPSLACLLPQAGGGGDGGGAVGGCDAAGSLEFDVVVPASLTAAVGAEVGTPLAVVAVAQSSRGPGGMRHTLYFQAVPKALVGKMPGMTFSSYEATLRLAPPVLIIGDATYTRLIEYMAAAVGVNATARGLPVRPPRRTLLVRLVPDATAMQRLAVIDSLRPFLDDNAILVPSHARTHARTHTCHLARSLARLLACMHTQARDSASCGSVEVACPCQCGDGMSMCAVPLCSRRTHCVSATPTHTRGGLGFAHWWCTLHRWRTLEARR